MKGYSFSEHSGGKKALMRENVQPCIQCECTIHIYATCMV